MQVTRAHGLPVVNPIRLDGKFQDSVPIVGGMFFKDADPRLVAGPGRPGPAVPVRAVRAQLPALLALPHAADLLRAAVLVHPHHRGQGPAAGRERADQLVPAERSSTAGTASGCATTWTGRCPGPATGARRCRCGSVPDEHVTCVGSLAELAELAGQDLSSLDPHRPFVDEITFGCPRLRDAGPPGPRRHRRLVRLGVDAVRPVRRALAARGGVRAGVSRPSSSARRSTRPAAGSTR